MHRRYGWRYRRGDNRLLALGLLCTAGHEHKGVTVRITPAGLAAIGWPVVETDEQCEAALAELGTLMGAQLGTPEGERLDRLADAIGAYERVRWPFPEPTPEERASFRRDQEQR